MCESSKTHAHKFTDECEVRLHILPTEHNTCEFHECKTIPTWTLALAGNDTFYDQTRSVRNCYLSTFPPMTSFLYRSLHRLSEKLCIKWNHTMCTMRPRQVPCSRHVWVWDCMFSRTAWIRWTSTLTHASVIRSGRRDKPGILNPRPASITCVARVHFRDIGQFNRRILFQSSESQWQLYAPPNLTISISAFFPTVYLWV
jgi:hypothetical protein